MDLFELLKEIVGCTYISDLNFGLYRIMAINALRKMDTSNIDSKQLKDAYNYLGVTLA